MLEDESGRIQLVGDLLSNVVLVTGVIMGVLGLETPTGEFEVVDVCFAGLAPQLHAAELQGKGKVDNTEMDIDSKLFICS